MGRKQRARLTECPLQRYLKTTVGGLTGCLPDFVMLMVGANAGLVRADGAMAGDHPLKPCAAPHLHPSYRLACPRNILVWPSHLLCRSWSASQRST